MANIAIVFSFADRLRSILNVVTFLTVMEFPPLMFGNNLFFLTLSSYQKDFLSL